MGEPYKFNTELPAYTYHMKILNKNFKTFVYMYYTQTYIYSLTFMVVKQNSHESISVTSEVERNLMVLKRDS